MEDQDITRLVRQAKQDIEAQERLFRLVEAEFRQRANHQLNREGQASLFATDLVNEAFPKLINDPNLEIDNRFAFYRLASRVMRQILIDHARKRMAEKRGGREQPVHLDQIDEPTQRKGLTPSTILAIHEALESLTTESAVLAEVVELHCFGGFTLSEIAESQGIHKDSVKRRWRLAKVYLQKHLGDLDEGK